MLPVLFVMLTAGAPVKVTDGLEEGLLPAPVHALLPLSLRAFIIVYAAAVDDEDMFTLKTSVSFVLNLSGFEFAVRQTLGEEKLIVQLCPDALIMEGPVTTKPEGKGILND